MAREKVKVRVIDLRDNPKWPEIKNKMFIGFTEETERRERERRIARIQLEHSVYNPEKGQYVLVR